MAIDERIRRWPLGMMLLLVALLLMTAGLDVQFFASRSGIVSFSIAEVLAALLLASLGIRLALLPPQERGRILHPVYAMNPFVTGYALWAVAASLIGFATMGTTETLHSLKNLVPALAAYVGIVTVCRVERQIWKLHVALILMLLGVSAIAFSQHFVGVPYVNQLDPNAFNKLRLGGGFVSRPVVGMLGHPNALGTLLAPLIVVTLGFLRHRGQGALHGPLRLLGWWTLIAAAGALGLTAAKAAILWAMAGGAIVMAGATARVRPTPGRSLLVLTILLGTAVAGIGLALRGRMPLPGGIEVGTIADRFILDFEALGRLTGDRSTLLFGGVGRRFGSLSVLQLGVHNELLAQALRFGAPAGFLFAAVLIRSCVARPGRAGWTYTGAVIAVCGVYLLEAASGAQLQLAAFTLIGLAAANERIAVEDLAASTA